jgi:threonine aldolase
MSLEMPEPPSRSFASDNAAGAHPAVIDAVQRANHGHALAYGDDDHTRECEGRFRELFGRDVATFLTFNGTGANVMALTALIRPGDAVICSDWAHINVDETGAPERIVGAKLIDLPTVDAKLTPAQIEHQAHAIGVPHHSQPAVVSLTQSTELGTAYTADEIGEICDAAHRLGMLVHLDGARIANAVAARGGTADALRSMTVDAGVDVMTFGGTKNGMLGGEAVVFLRSELAARGHFVRKTVTQLPSKMRFVAAQFNALLDGDLWLALAGHANAMATALHEAASRIDGVEIGPPPAVNSVFPLLPADVIEPLRSWCFFWDWNPDRHQVRWMTAWDTTAHDVERFTEGVRAVLAARN